MTTPLPVTCPVCGNAGSIVCHEDLGPEGIFCICSTHTGCGTSFILTPQGLVTDIF